MNWTGPNGVFDLTGGSFDQTAGTFSMSGSGGVFDFSGGVIAGNPVINLQNKALTLGAAGTSAATFQMRGPSSTLIGDISAGQSLLVQGSDAGGAATLTSAAGFSNSGTVTMESIDGAHAVTLNLGSGSLANLPGGVFNAGAGAGGTRTLTGNLTNDGTVNLNINTTFNGGLKTYTNDASFNIPTGTTLNLTAPTNTFIQAAGTLDIDGALNWTGSNGTFDLDGGPFDQTNGAFNMTGSSGAFNFNGGAIVGNPVINLRNKTLTLGVAGTSAATFQARGPSSTLTGDISAGQTLLIQGSDAGGAATLTSAAGFSNSGTVTMESIDGAHAVTLSLGSGTLANLPGGVFNANAGAGGTRTLTGNLTNDGTVNLNIDTTFNGGLKTYTNNASFNIANGTNLNFTASSNTFTQAAGTLDIDGGVNWTGPNGVFDLDGGTFDQTIGTFSMSGSGGAFNFTGGVIVGNPVINLQNKALTLGAAGTSAATFQARGPSSTLTGDISAGQTLLIQGSDAGADATLTSAAGFSNSGTVTMESIDGAHAVTLNLGSGSLANLPGGVWLWCTITVSPAKYSSSSSCAPTLSFERVYQRCAPAH